MTKSSPDPESASKTGKDSTQWLAFLNLGWLLAANMAVFVGAGLWADGHFGTAPLLLLVGVFLAFAGCGYTLYRAVKKIESDERSQAPRLGGPAAPKDMPGP